MEREINIDACRYAIMYLKNKGFKSIEVLKDHRYHDVSCDKMLEWLDSQKKQHIKIEESNFSKAQYIADIDSAWLCGYHQGLEDAKKVISELGDKKDV